MVPEGGDDSINDNAGLDIDPPGSQFFICQVKQRREDLIGFCKKIPVNHDIYPRIGIQRKKTVWRFQELGVGVVMGLRGAHFILPLPPSVLAHLPGKSPNY